MRGEHPGGCSVLSFAKQLHRGDCVSISERGSGVRAEVTKNDIQIGQIDRA